MLNLLIGRRPLLLGLFAAIAAMPRSAPAASLGANAGAGPGRVRLRLEKWECTNKQCEPYVYDPSKGDINAVDLDHPIPPGVAFADLPDTWRCPICNDPKSDFEPTGDWVEVWVDA
ncbi:MAG: rubredoxin [Hyphomicrobiales bacterium]